LPETIFAHGWWTVDGEKMSKSRGNVVDPNTLIDEIGADAFRYFLLREVPFGHDGDFSRDALNRRLNSELANGIGNLLSRTLTMIERFSNGTIPSIGVPANTALENVIRTFSESLANKVCLYLENSDSTVNPEFHLALNEIQNLVTQVDIYIDETAPWSLAKKAEDGPKLQTVLFYSAQALRYLCYVLYPFMPHTAATMSKQLGLALDYSKPLLNQIIKWDDPSIPGTKIAKGTSLFPRIESKPQGAKSVSDTPTSPQPTAAAPQTLAPAAPAPAAPAQITIDEFMKIQLKTAKVLTVERVPKSEKLLKLQVSLGEGTEPRQIVAGIGKKYEPEALIGKTIIIVANLKPAKLMGIESQGMVLAAGDSEVRGLVTILEEVDPGTKVK
ncbi:MAG: methionine--tRNA ligase subunit beta, partial [Terriglobia bacterium]